MDKNKAENPRYSELQGKQNRTPEEQAEFDRLDQEKSSATSQDK